MGQTQKYKLLPGGPFHLPTPTEEDVNAKKVFQPGEVVESDRDLENIFRNRFEKVIPGINTPVVVTDARRQEVGRLIEGGTWSEDDRSFLEGLSEDDYARLQRKFGQGAPGGLAETEGQGGKEDAPPAGRQQKVRSHLGEDVTEQFPKASQAGFSVFKNPAGKHQLLAAESRGKGKPVNKEAMDAADVDGWVEEHGK